MSVVGLLLVPRAALAAQSHSFLETFGSANQPSLAKPEGMAVDQSNGDLLVIEGETDTISRWKPNGEADPFSALGTNVIDGQGTGNCATVPSDCDETPEGGLFFFNPTEAQIAIDNSGGTTDGNIYVTHSVEPRAVEIFASDGHYLGHLTESTEGPFGEPCGVAVDPSGNVYVGDYQQGIHKFEPSGSFPEDTDSTANFPFVHVCTLAAGAGPTAGSIFPAAFEGPVSKLSSTNGAKKYVVDSGKNTTETVDPASGHLYTASGNEVKEYDASGALQATLLSSIAPEANPVTGIAVNGATGNVYVTRAESSDVEVWGPAVLLPDVTTEEAAVGTDSVTLHGTLSAAGGPPATCVFEYVEVGADDFEGASSAPCSPAGPFTGTSNVAVSAEISGLAEGAYRFRLVASSENGSNRGQTLLFGTEPALPDGRAYEMVSPARKLGEVFPPDPTQGSCFNCEPGLNNAMAPMLSAPDGEAVAYQGQPLFTGLAFSTNEYLSRRTPNGWVTQGLSPPNISSGQTYRAFSADLSRGVLRHIGPALSPEAPTRGEETFANLYLWQEGALRPLLTEEPLHRGAQVPFSEDIFRIFYGAANSGAASSPAFTHILFAANDALTGPSAFAPAAPEVEATFCEVGANCNLYEWHEGQLRLVNVLPGNATAAAGGVLGSRIENGESPAVDNAISADGSHIFWSNGAGQVFVRIDGEATEKIEDPGGFLIAGADGSRVLLDDGCLYDLQAKACADLTAGEGGLQGILGAAEDLSRIYFADTKVLTGGEENANEEAAEEGKLNLYAWQEGTTSFIGALLGNDNHVKAISGSGSAQTGAWLRSSTHRTAQVSPDGRYLAFMSRASLTGYDNRLRGGGLCLFVGDARCYEVFLYDAAAAKLTCVSCNPSRERPLGGSNLSLIKLEFPNGGAALPQMHNLAPDGQGRLFFESQDALSPRDLNGKVQDVYQWEPNGVGSCERAAGCLSLISSGHSPNDSMFAESSASGDDAFFITREQLLPRDQDERLDLYDARVGGGFQEAGPPCLGEACRGPLSIPPEQPSPGSSTFSGLGNEKPRHRKHTKRCKRKKRCKHQKHRKRAPRHGRGGSK